MIRPLDLELLRTFIAITDRESFALAAEQVHRTQSAVTQQMARLEEQLGVALFRKVGRSKRLTEHGVRLLDYARRLLALNEEALASLAAPDLRGPLRIGSIYDATEFLLPPLLARFSQLYPNLQIEVHTDRTAHLLQALKRDEIEIALVGQPEGNEEPVHPGVRLRTSPMVWMAAVEYVHDRTQPVPLVVPDQPSAYRASALAALEAHGIAWRIRHVSTSLAFSSLRAALRAGLGVTARTIEMLTPDLRVLTEAEGLPRLPNLHLDLYLRDEHVSPPARRLFESVGESAVRLPVRSHRARLRPRHGSLRA
jgi:DNA-binding transcriptional LysR family regulator